MTYDPENIFAKILRGEIPNNTVYENDHVLAFRDITPQAPVHILIIPKGAYTDMTDFASAGTDEKAAMVDAVQAIVKQEGLETGGYRLITNTGADGGQEVPHLHWHILAGEPIGKMRCFSNGQDCS